MKRLLGFVCCRCVLLCCLFLPFCPASRSQNITLNWPEAPGKQLQSNSSPPKSSVTEHPNPATGGPTDGSLRGHTYTNNFFRFSLSFPEGWKVLIVDKGQADKGDVLLYVWTVEKKTNGKSVIVISSTNLPSDFPGITAEELLKRVANGAKLGLMPDPWKTSIHWVPTTEPRRISIGGKQVARLDLTGRASNYSVRWSQLALIHRGCLVMFQFADPDGDATEMQAMQSINSLHFFGSAN